MPMKSTLRKSVIVLLAVVLLSFTIVHLSLCWAFSVLLKTAFTGLLLALWPVLLSLFLAVLLLLVVILTVASTAADVTLPAYEAAGAHLLHAQVVVDLVRVFEKAGIPGTLRSWAKAVRVFAWPFLAAWLVVLCVALLRTQLIQYQPVMVLLLWGLILAVVFAKKKWKLVFIGAIVVFFLFTDVGKVKLSGVSFPDVSLGLPGGLPIEQVPSREVTISGGMLDWVTVYEDVPFTNRFEVQHISGSMRIATQAGDVVDNLGLLQENGVPFNIRTARHLLDAGVKPSDWLVTDTDATPFSLVGCAEDDLTACAENGFTVRDRILVRKGQRLRLWYNHVVRGQYGDNFRQDRGQYLVRVVPAESGLPE